MGSVKRLVNFASIALLGLILFAPEAKAQQSSTQFLMDSRAYTPEDGLTAQGRIAETGYFDSNPLLQTTSTKSLWGSITSPELLVDDITPMTTVTSDTIFTSNNFNQSDFDSNDVHEKFNVARQNQRWSLGMLGAFDYDTTRTSELSVYNNIRSTPVRHTGGYATPTLTYNYLPTDRISVSGNYTQSHYSGASTFTDFNTYSVTPTYLHDFDPLNTGFASMTAQRYQALSGPQSSTDSFGPQFGWRSTLTDQLKGTVSVGFEEVHQKTATAPSQGWNTEYTMSGGIDFHGDQDLASFQVSRNEYPFGNGTEALLTQLLLSEVHAINGLFSIAGAGSYQSADYQINSPGSLDSLATGTLSLIYHVTDRVDLTTSYQYERETLIDTSATAQKHVGLLTLIFTPQTWDLR